MSDLELLALESLAADGVSASPQGVSPSELHGAVVGIGAWDTERFELQDLVDLIGVDALSDEARVSEFVGASLDALYAEDMSFAPLLPDDESPMTEQLTGLAAWCHGFLSGLAVGWSRDGIGSLSELPEQVQEIVRDLVAISQIDIEPAQGDEEEDFVQLAEHLKVCALLIMSLRDDVGDHSEE